MLSLGLILAIRAEKQGKILIKLEMWANAQRDGRPAEYRWRPQFG